jgi:hypothetical protein
LEQVKQLQPWQQEMLHQISERAMWYQASVKEFQVSPPEYQVSPPEFQASREFQA